MSNFTPTFHYNLNGSLSYDEQKENYKSLTYRLMNHPQAQYRWTSVDAVTALIGWIHMLSLGNPGHVNTVYSNNGKGFLAWPDSPLSAYAADLGLPWYDGLMQSGFLQYHMINNWSGSSPFPTFQTFITQVVDDTQTKANQLYYYYLRQFLVGVPEASYGGDLSDGMANAIAYYGERWGYWINRWINDNWSDGNSWLLFAFQRKKERGELIL